MSKDFKTSEDKLNTYDKHKNWNECFPNIIQPQMPQISSYVNSPLWNELCKYLEETYNILPRIEHSICSGAPAGM